MADSVHIPEGHTVDAVDWLPSGAGSGLVRVRGHRPESVAAPLPDLVVESGGAELRFVSLPDPRADRDPSAWRGAYVLDARPAAEADRLWLEWPGGRRMPLPPLVVPAHQIAQSRSEPEAAEAPPAEVVDRAVLAEHRARRAEASEQTQARLAREALHAVEVLELRLAATEEERDAAQGPDPRLEALSAEVRELRTALAEAQAAAPVAPVGASEAERRAERLRDALTATVATVAELRMRLHESDVARRTRDVGYAADAVRLAVLDREHAELEARHTSLAEERETARARVVELEAEVEALTAEVARTEAALEASELARELAEATALAATAQRRAAAVAAAAPGTPEEAAAPPSVPTSAPEPAPERLVEAAQDQAEKAEQAREPEPQVVADLDAARNKLRERATIVSPPGAPPADVARGRGGRRYPALRGALVKLAHDDPEAAGRFLAGLLPAQHAAVTRPPPDYDLTIAEVGTFAVSAAGRTTLVSPIGGPRGRGHAAFHLRSDALSLAELLAGVERRAHRLHGPIRASGKVREARRLTESLRADASLADLARAGADLDPALVLRGLAYSVGSAWTQGQKWAVELVVGDRTMSVAAGHSGGLIVADGPHDREPDARLRMTDAAFRDLVAGDPVTYAAEGDEEVVRRLLALAARARGDA